jgi:hypothetical protein
MTTPRIRRREKDITTLDYMKDHELNKIHIWMSYIFV